MWRRTKILLSYTVPALLLAAFAGLWICQFNQWDSLTFITVIPFWMWALPGILFSLAAAILIRSRFSILVLAIWLLTAIFGSAETRGVLRSLGVQKITSPIGSGRVLKLVSINCEGNLEAARAAIHLNPDILLLQEAPGRDDLEVLTKLAFGEAGSFVAANSNAILGKGTFLTFGKDETSPTIHARFKHQSGSIFDLTNVHLDRSIPEKEIWKASVREKMRLTRIKNRKDIREIIDGYRLDRNQPVRIVAGDFSTPPGDDIFRPLATSGLRDAYPESGLGTGNTFPGNFPVLRLDQVWISPEARLLKTFTVDTEYSNHEILVCDFNVTPQN